ncbi:transmembrane protein, putative, partial [Bodo saltans]
LPTNLVAVTPFIYPVAPPVVLPTAGTAYVSYVNNISTTLESYLVAYNTIPPTPTSPLLTGFEVLSVSGSIISGVVPLSTNTAAVSVSQANTRSTSGASVVELKDDSVPGVIQVNTLWSIDRLNSSYTQLLAIPQLDLIIFGALLPTKPAPYPQSMEIVAVNSSAQKNSAAAAPNIVWNRTWVTPITPGGGAPLYYDGMIYFFHGNALNRVNALTGLTSAIFNDPCNQNATNATAVWNFAIPSFDIDPTNGQSLDAFILYANLTASSTTVCRFSHTTGKAKWSTGFYGSFVFDDVYGAGGNIFMTGRNVNTNTSGGYVQYITWVQNATTGNVYPYPYARNAQDAESFPRMMPSWMSQYFLGGLDGPVMVQQALGVTYAYFAAHPGSIVWQAQGACHHTPLMVTPNANQPNTTYVGCTDVTNGKVTLLHATNGSTVWSYDFDVAKSLATDNIYVYAVGTHGALAQLSVEVASKNSFPTPSPVGGEPSGLSSGAKAGAAIGGLLCAAVVIAVAVHFVRTRSVRRQAGYSSPKEDPGHYGAMNE